MIISACDDSGDGKPYLLGPSGASFTNVNESGEPCPDFNNAACRLDETYRVCVCSHSGVKNDPFPPDEPSDPEEPWDPDPCDECGGSGIPGGDSDTCDPNFDRNCDSDGLIWEATLTCDAEVVVDEYGYCQFSISPPTALDRIEMWSYSGAGQSYEVFGSRGENWRAVLQTSGWVVVDFLIMGEGDPERLGSWIQVVESSSCGDDRDAMIEEYTTKYPVDLNPECDWFTTDQSVRSEYFSNAELTRASPSIGPNPHAPFALIRWPLVVPRSSGWGLDRVRELWGNPINLNSGYRCPHANDTTGGVAQSRHMFGDAADMRVESRTQDEADVLLNRARQAGAHEASYVGYSSLRGELEPAWVHADWRHREGHHVTQ